MPTAPSELRGPNSLKKPRRLSFADPPKVSSSTGLRSKTMKYIGVNFYFSQIQGLPGSWLWLRQYRIAVQADELRSTTSWKVSNQADFRVDETSEGMDLLMSSELILSLERRNLLNKPTLIGKTKKFTVSDLITKQHVHRPDPILLELDSKGECSPLFLELNVRSFPSPADPPIVPDGESRARIVYEAYPDTVSKTLTALREFVFVLSDPSKQLSYRTLIEMVEEMGKYILAHPRKQLSYDCENNAWLFLRETTKCLESYRISAGKAAQSTGQLVYLANRILRGFWLLFQLHTPRFIDHDHRHHKFIEKELLQIGDSFTRKPNPPVANSIPVQYHALLKLKGVDMSPPSLQAPGIEPLFCNTPFKEITRWMVDHEPEHQVFWLHGKFESGTARSQIVAALLETAKICSFPTAYYSLSRGATHSQTEKLRVQFMLGSMIYQLARYNHDLRSAFGAAITENSEDLESVDFYSRFQIILHTLLSLSLPERANAFPVLLVIDGIEPFDNGSPSTEYSQLLHMLYTASIATRAITPASSPTPDSSFGDILSAGPPTGVYRDSLPLPSFLRIVVLSRSLGNDPSLIEQFAFIRAADSHRLSGSRFPNDKASRLYNSAVVNGSHKGKARERVPLDSAPLIPIAEVNSQAGGNRSLKI